MAHIKIVTNYIITDAEGNIIFKLVDELFEPYAAIAIEEQAHMIARRDGLAVIDAR